jgi:hypothetical protein
MIFVEQLIPHDPTKGLNGDCFRAVIATLLQLPAEAVPHFIHDNPSSEVFNQRLQDFLVPLGYFYMCFDMFDFDKWKREAGISVPIYHELSGPSPRFPELDHSVVGKDGKVIYDPHPDKQGLDKVTRIGFLVKATY